MSDCWSGRGDGGGWNPSFTRPFNDWEVEDAVRLLAKLGRYVVVLEVEDHWELSKDGVFSIRSLYQALEPGFSGYFSWASMWKLGVQPKISFFTWEAGKGFDS